MNYETKIAELISQWTSSYNEYSSLFIKAERYYKDYLSVFQSQENQIYKQKYVTTCLWLSESRYLITIMYLHSFLASSSVLAKDIWNTVKQLEINRLDSIKTSIESFLSLHNNIFRQNTEEVSILLNGIPLDTMDISSVHSEEEMNFFIEEFGDKELFEGLATWELSMPPRSNLIVKVGLIERETAVFKVWKTSYAVLTVDRFLHIFNEDITQNFQEPINSCYLSKATIIENEELYFEIIEAKPLGILSKLSAPRRSVFKLNTLQEFLEWVKMIKDLT